MQLNISKTKIGSFAGLFLLAVIGRFLNMNHGAFYLDHVIGFTGFFILFWIVNIKTPSYSNYFEGSILVLWCYFCVLISMKTGLTPIIGCDPYQWLVYLIHINTAFAFFVFILFLVVKKLPNWISSLLMLSLVCFFICHILVLFVSPNPYIDVYRIMTKGADLLIHGHNPYNFIYPDIYGGKFIPLYGDPKYIYWPAGLISTSIMYFLGFDIRTVYIICLFLTLLGIYKLTEELKIPKVLGLLVLLLWISFPITLFELEMAWIEGLILPPFIFLIYFIIKKRWYFAGVMGALICTTKQYNIFIILFTLLYIYREGSIKAVIKFSSICLAITLLIFAPFVFWNPEHFFTNTIIDLMHYKMRQDSFSWVALFKNRLYTEFPSIIISMIYFSTFLFGCFMILNKKVLAIRAFTFSTVIMYGVVFLFGKQSFNNYYYLWSFFLLCFIISQCWMYNTFAENGNFGTKVDCS